MAVVPIPSLTSHEAFDSGVVLGWCLARLRQPGWSITAAGVRGGLPDRRNP